MDLYSKLNSKGKLFLIAGPCVVEQEKMMLETAENLVKETDKRGITFIFKSSYKKANRTSISSPMGAGLDKGLKILRKIKEHFAVPILTDVHETSEIDSAADVADILQIPAFLSRQTDLLLTAGNSGRIVNIKKGQFMAPLDMKSAAEKIISSGNYNILLTERGTCFGYHNLVVDFRSFAVMQQLKFPVVYDVTHSLQQPSLGNVSGGTPEFAPMMARAAVATGMVDGLFIETHPHPMEALSDAQSMLPLDQIPQILDECLQILKVNNDRL